MVSKLFDISKTRPDSVLKHLEREMLRKTGWVLTHAFQYDHPRNKPWIRVYGHAGASCTGSSSWNVGVRVKRKINLLISSSRLNHRDIKPVDGGTTNYLWAWLESTNGKGKSWIAAPPSDSERPVYA